MNLVENNYQSVVRACNIRKTVIIHANDEGVRDAACTRVKLLTRESENVSINKH